MSKLNINEILLVILAIFLIVSISIKENSNDNVLKHYDTVKIKLNDSSDFEEYKNVSVINENTLYQTYTIKLEDGSTYTIKYDQLED